MIVVAGGTGFIGGAIAIELARRGSDVAVLSHRKGPGTIRLAGRDVPIRTADVEDRRSLDAALAGAETVVGAVQFAGFPNENPGKGLTFDNVDRRGTEQLLAAAKQNGVNRYVYVSGAGAAPNALKPWFKAKWAAEEAVRSSGLAYAIFRPSWVYGPRDRGLNRYVGFVKSPLPVVPVVGDGKQRLQPVYVEDVARAIAESLGPAGPDGGTYEIGGPDIVSMDEVIRTVERVTGRRKPLVHSPVWLMKALFSPKALIPSLPLPLSPSGVEFATMDALADNAPLLRARPAFRLTPLREGLEQYLGTNQRPGARASS